MNINPPSFDAVNESIHLVRDITRKYHFGPGHTNLSQREEVQRHSHWLALWLEYETVLPTEHPEGRTRSMRRTRLQHVLATITHGMLDITPLERKIYSDGVWRDVDVIQYMLTWDTLRSYHAYLVSLDNT
jgi:hypothetical protein